MYYGIKSVTVGLKFNAVRAYIGCPLRVVAAAGGLITDIRECLGELLSRYDQNRLLTFRLEASKIDEEEVELVMEFTEDCLHEQRAAILYMIAHHLFDLYGGTEASIIQRLTQSTPLRRLVAELDMTGVRVEAPIRELREARKLK